MKNFFKPTVLTIVVFVIFIILTAFLPHKATVCNASPDGGISCGSHAVPGIGYPLFFGEQCVGDMCFTGFNPYTLVINIVVFYLLASLVTVGIRKLKGAHFS